MSYVRAALIAIDQLINALLGGWPDETLSSRCWRLSLAGRDWPRRVVDTLFFFDAHHCKESYESERTGRQQPPELRPPLHGRHKGAA